MGGDVVEKGGRTHRAWQTDAGGEIGDDLCGFVVRGANHERRSARGRARRRAPGHDAGRDRGIPLPLAAEGDGGGDSARRRAGGVAHGGAADRRGANRRGRHRWPLVCERSGRDARDDDGRRRRASARLTCARLREGARPADEEDPRDWLTSTSWNGDTHRHPRIKFSLKKCTGYTGVPTRIAISSRCEERGRVEVTSQNTVLRDWRSSARRRAAVAPTSSSAVAPARVPPSRGG